MGWKAFIASLVSSVAWPAVCAYLLWLMRDQLAQLAERIEEFTLPGGAKAKFVKAIESNKDDTQELAGETTLPIELDQERIKLAALSPEAAIIVSFKEIEHLLLQIRDKLGLEARSNLRAVMSQLRQRGLVSEVASSVFERLRYARNEAAHVAEEISAEEAMDYAEQARLLKNTLQKVLDAL